MVGVQAAHPQKCMVPSGNQTWHLEIHSFHGGFNRNITYKHWIFHCHVWLPEGTVVFMNTCEHPNVLVMKELSYLSYPHIVFLCEQRGAEDGPHLVAIQIPLIPQPIMGCPTNHTKLFVAWKHLPSGNQTWQLEIHYKWKVSIGGHLWIVIFHCHVWFPEGMAFIVV